jgi:hypothetical protein
MESKRKRAKTDPNQRKSNQMENSLKLNMALICFEFLEAE